ncbi:glycosyltransferase family 92 protein F49C12.5-like [Engystomops pustulosus]|uniref:glycosyltransferase family 92 protein F49C12.5-like n=1 Tax=Engystomops pustulosus TaxID=76066 RepID=UPI003AFA6DFA
MKKVLVALIFSIFLLVSILYNYLPKESAGIKVWRIFTHTNTFPQSNKTIVISRDSITPLENNKTFVISAYYDARESRTVRVLTINHGEDVKELYCWFYCQEDDSEYVSVKATIETHSLWFGFRYGPADVLCPEPRSCSSKHISIHWSISKNTNHVPVFEIRNRDPQPFSADFTVCISTMFGKQDNILQYIQALEMYRILGAQKVVIYKNSCSEAIGHVLDHYVSEGFVEIVPWPIDRYLRTSDVWHQSMNKENQIGYYGQLPALSDCLYRNMYRSRYVTFNDIDEIILPRHHQTWHDLMKDLEKDYPNAAVYLIENHYFPKNITVPDFQAAFPKNVPGTNILQLVYYEPEQPNVYNNHKMIVNPREVIQISVHFASKTRSVSVDVPNHIAGLHHGRAPKQPNLPQTSLIKDTTIWKYNSSLIMNVNEVLRQLNLH